MPISHGPASAASDETMIAVAVKPTARRCGRSRSDSSTRLRRRSSAASGAETSSTCSLPIPRQDGGAPDGLCAGGGDHVRAHRCTSSIVIRLA